MVRRERLEETEPRPDDIERTVPVEQALPAVPADDGTEAKVAIPRLLVGGAAWGQRAGFEHGLRHDRRMITRRRPSGLMDTGGGDILANRPTDRGSDSGETGGAHHDQPEREDKRLVEDGAHGLPLRRLELWRLRKVGACHSWQLSI